LVITLVATVGSVGLGVASGIYAVEYAASSTLAMVLRRVTHVATAIPPVLVGALMAWWMFPHLRPTAVLAGAVVGVCCLPEVVEDAQVAIRSFPLEAREVGRSLGASRFQLVWRVVLPGSAHRLAALVLRTASRAMGLVAPLLFLGVLGGTSADRSSLSSLSSEVFITSVEVDAPFATGALVLLVWSSVVLRVIARLVEAERV